MKSRAEKLSSGETITEQSVAPKIGEVFENKESIWEQTLLEETNAVVESS